MPPKKNRAVYQIKVSLRDIHPPLWRRVHVWEDITLAQLHRILQIVMSWEDYHLHDFRIGSRTYSVPDPDDAFSERTVVDEKRTRLCQVIPHVGTQFEYRYDFGDGWHHDLLLEAISIPDPAMHYPFCAAGERRTPPEDVGGPFQYPKYLEALADPDHEEHEDWLRWRGPFDPELFSLATVNQQLQKKFPAPKKTAPAAEPKVPAGLRIVPPPASRSKMPVQSPPQPTNPARKIELELSSRERELILDHTFADGHLIRALEIPGSGASRRQVYYFSLGELEELAGFVAAEANHATNKKLGKELDALFDRIDVLLDKAAN